MTDQTLSETMVIDLSKEQSNEQFYRSMKALFAFLNEKSKEE